jgi:membrane protease YdiL (CAAX protease family)
MYTRLCKIKSNDMPALNAYFLIMILQAFNIGTIFVVVNYFAKIHFAKNAHIYQGLSLAFVLAVINYFPLYAKRDKIFKKYANVSPKRKVKGLIYFWLYVLLSTIIFWTAVANLVPQK